MNEPLPPRSAMHRDNPKGSRLDIANAYAVGRLVDGQAIADVWRKPSESQQAGHRGIREELPELAALLDDIAFA